MVKNVAKLERKMQTNILRVKTINSKQLSRMGTVYYLDASDPFSLFVKFRA